jgi:PadR family transcriptional regulator PadR
MDAQLKRGLLDACLLAILSQGESYGYKIIQSAQTVMSIRESTLYPVLRRMEQQGYLETWQQEYSGRLRKYYRITDFGRERLENFRTEWRDVKNMVDYIMGGVQNDSD